MQAPRILIAGAGWAGLAAAVELSARGLPVTLLEAARQVGGRARSVPFGGQQVDNGQHLLIGAYSDTLRLMDTVGVDPEQALQRHSLELLVLDVAGQVALRLEGGPLPAPLHLLWGLLTAEGLSWGERFGAIRFAASQAHRGFHLNEDCSLLRLLRQHRQSRHLIAALWEPLCLATLNTDAEHASARVFLRVLRDAFARRRHDADLLFPAQDLDRLFPNAALAFLARKGAHCHTRWRLRGFELDGSVPGAAVTVHGDGGRSLKADYLVLATPPHLSARWLASHPALAATAEGLSELGSDPITTLYLQYPPESSLGRPMLGLLGGHGQWIIDRGLTCAQPGLMAVVISGPGPHMAWDKARLTETVCRELAARFPHWPAPCDTLLIREKRATFHCAPDTDRLRPPNRSPHPRLWLAGDYTDTGYPATLEGAVRSGVQCAHDLYAQIHGARAART